PGDYVVNNVGAHIDPEPGYGRYNTSAAEFTIPKAPTSPPTPQINGFSPPNGSPGTVITITGSNLNPAPPVPSNPGFAQADVIAAPLATVVKFNGTAATIDAITDTQISTKVPAGATTGPGTVTTAAGTATSPTGLT